MDLRELTYKFAELFQTYFDDAYDSFFALVSKNKIIITGPFIVDYIRFFIKKDGDRKCNDMLIILPNRFDQFYLHSLSDDCLKLLNKLEHHDIEKHDYKKQQKNIHTIKKKIMRNFHFSNDVFQNFLFIQDGRWIFEIKSLYGIIYKESFCNIRYDTCVLSHNTSLDVDILFRDYYKINYNEEEWKKLYRLVNSNKRVLADNPWIAGNSYKYTLNFIINLLYHEMMKYYDNRRIVKYYCDRISELGRFEEYDKIQRVKNENYIYAKKLIDKYINDHDNIVRFVIQSFVDNMCLSVNNS